MTSLERVGAALSGRFADRRAWTMVLSLYGARLSGATPERYYREPRLFAAGQRAVLERFEPDILFAPFALTLEAEAHGAELVWPAKSPPNVRRPLPLGEAPRLTRLRPEDSPSLSYLVESLRLVAEAAGKSHPIAGILVAPVDLPALIFGIDAWIETILFDRPLAASLLDFSVHQFTSMARAYFEAGASFIATPVMFANPRIMSPPLVESLMLPALARAFAEVGGPVVFHHGAIAIDKLIGLWKGLPNVAGFVADERDSFERIRATVGDKPLLLGGFTGPLMDRRSPERLRGLVRTVLADRAEDPRFILASSAADLPWDTPPETILAVIDELRIAARAVSGGVA